MLITARWEDVTPDLASAASRFGNANPPPRRVPPTVRKSRLLIPSQNPPRLCCLPKIVSITKLQIEIVHKRQGWRGLWGRLDQFLDRLRVIQKINRFSIVVIQRRLRINIQDSVESCKHILWCIGMSNRSFAAGVCGSNDLSNLQPTTGKNGKSGLWPVIAACGGPFLCAHSRSPAHLTPDHDRDIFFQSPVVQIRQERMNRLVVLRQDGLQTLE